MYNSDIRSYSNELDATFTNVENDTLSINNKTILTEELRQYYDKLINSGVMFKRSDLKKMKMIDMRDICTYNRHYGNSDLDSCIPDVSGSRITDDFLWNNFWYCYIPCFNEGVLQLNKARYLYWKIKKLNIAERTMDIFVCDYNRISEIWQMGTNLNAHFIFEPSEIVQKYSQEILRRKISEDSLMRVRLVDYQTSSQIYKIIPIDNFNWNHREIEIWKHMVSISEAAEHNLRKKNTNAGLELLKIFTHFILVANQELYFNKPKADRKANSQKKKVKIEAGEVLHSDKIVRVVGGIKMTSEKPPRMPSKESVIKYKTAVWTARGGIRHMKNGKLVPFRESVRHRKCLQSDANDNIPVTKIIMKGTKK